MHVSPSNKKYVGITSAKPAKRRWANGRGYTHNQYFIRAIDKYGWDNFQHMILYDNLSFDVAKRIEQIVIQLFKTTQYQYGYNITAGGEGAFGLQKTPKMISAIKLANSYPVYQFDLDYNYIAEYPGVRDAAKAIGIKSKTSIAECCNLKKGSSGGYIWRFVRDVYDPLDKYCIPKYTYKYNLPIYQIDIETRQYRKWDSIRQASGEDQCAFASITACCSGRKNMFQGSIWKHCRDIQDIESFVSDDRNIYVGNYNYIWMCDQNGSKLKLFHSYMQAADTLHLDRKKIKKACQTYPTCYGGYLWQYAMPLANVS